MADLAGTGLRKSRPQLKPDRLPRTSRTDHSRTHHNHLQHRNTGRISRRQRDCRPNPELLPQEHKRHRREQRLYSQLGTQCELSHIVRNADLPDHSRVDRPRAPERVRYVTGSFTTTFVTMNGSTVTDSNSTSVQ